MRNFLTGMLVQAGSSVRLLDTTVENNVLDGLDAVDNSSVTIAGDFVVRESGVFGVFLNNNSSATLSGASVTAEANTAGIQISVNSSVFISAFPPSPPSTIVARDNLGFGMTIVSNSHLFAFGAAAIETRRNGTNGISVFTRSGIDMDNGAKVTSEDNVRNGLLLENSSLNMFNMQGFPGSEVIARNNGEGGVSLVSEAILDMGGDARLVSEANPVGLLVDNGSIATVRNSMIDGNDEDVILSFGSRGDFEGNGIGSLSCDKTVLIRGDERCPKDGDDDDDDD